MKNLPLVFFVFMFAVSSCTSSGIEGEMPANEFQGVSHPTLSVEEARQRMLEIITTNGNCRLPCIWGITPGETTTSQREKLLSSLPVYEGEDFYVTHSTFSWKGEQGSGWGFGMRIGEIELSAGLISYDRDSVVDVLSLNLTGWRRDQEAFEEVFGEAHYRDIFRYYTLPELLSAYGRPSHVLTMVVPADLFVLRQYEPMYVIVIYENRGVMVQYTMPYDLRGDRYVGCFDRSFIALVTWSPNEKEGISLQELSSYMPGEGIDKMSYDFFFPLSVTTDMGLMEFYRRFGGKGGDQCLELPTRFWMP